MAILHDTRKDEAPTEMFDHEQEVETNIHTKDDSSIDEQDGGYGWICVLCQLLITACTWGVNGVSETDEFRTWTGKAY